MKKLQDERGIFLTEAMIAISILTLLMIVVMPILMHTYQERQIIRQKNEAISLLRYHLLSWKKGDSILTEPNTSTSFQIEWIEKNDLSAYLSVNWEYGGRTHRLSGEAKK